MPLRPLLLAALTALAACAETDPYRRAGMWQPTGVNERNLAAMAAEPRDLARGRGVPSAGWTGAAAVSRLLADTPKPLPIVGSQTAPGGSAKGP